MSDTPVPGTTMSILQEVMNAWVNRNERQAAKSAGRLTFWRDGMIQQIEAIAKGDRSAAVVEGLKQNFQESQHRVENTIYRLKEIRSKIGPSAIGKQVDLVINHADYGKTGIRMDIQILIWDIESMQCIAPERREVEEASLKRDAENLVYRIESFNAEVSRLQRLVESG